MAAALCGHSCCTPGCPEQPQQLQTAPQASLSLCQTRSKTLLVSHLAPASHQPSGGQCHVLLSWVFSLFLRHHASRLPAPRLSGSALGFCSFACGGGGGRAGIRAGR